MGLEFPMTINIFYTEYILQKNNVNFILKQVEDITIQLGKREEELAQAMMKVKKNIYLFFIIWFLKKILKFRQNLGRWRVGRQG